MAEAVFYKCTKCNNFFVAIEEGSCTPQCCGESMAKLVAGSTDAAREKHVPCVTRGGGRIAVKVGELAHPMLDAHFIQWVALVGDGRLEIHKLKPGEEPQTCFEDNGVENATVYEYCNLHGLWKAEV